MKKLMIFSTILMMTLLAACTKIKHLADINVNIPYTQQITVPDYAGGYAGFVIPGGGVELPFPAIPVATNSKAYITQYHTSADKILSVDLQSLSLAILTPPSQNFNFLDNVQVYISGQTLPEKLLAYDNDIAKGQTSLMLTTMTDVNLKDYFLQDTIYFRMTAHINSVPISGTQLQLSSVFHLLANPLE